jgi:hypothetical protein
MDDICMEQLPKDGNRMQQVLSEGKLLVLRTRDEFLYFLDGGDEYLMFNHTAGQVQAGRRKQPKTDKDGEMFAGAAKAVDTAFSVEFDPQVDIPTLLYSAEEAILQAYPMVGEEEKIDFSSYRAPEEH